MKTKYIAWVLTSVFCLVSCSQSHDEVVMSSYIEPTIPYPSYSFSRNGASSVDTQVCGELSETLTRIYTSYLLQAYIPYELFYNKALGYYVNGYVGVVRPESEVASSEAHRVDREQIRRDLRSYFDITARISGMGTPAPNRVRNTPLSAGHTGYIGVNVGDKNLRFADERGLVVAEAFLQSAIGATALDKVLNVHLLESTFSSQILRQAHEDLVFPRGANYTELEHHWDLAYGYYMAMLRPWVQSAGVSALKDVDRKLTYAFAAGRLALTEYRYSDMMTQLRAIESQLPRAVALRAIHSLLGSVTRVNLDEDPRISFQFLSQAYGQIYALQFTHRADGSPYLTYDETKQLLSDLLLEQGLWEQQRLLSGAQTIGSLVNVAQRIAERYGLNLDDYKQ